MGDIHVSSQQKSEGDDRPVGSFPSRRQKKGGSMTRPPARPPVARINPDVIRRAFREPDKSKARSGYFVLERGGTLVCLRVRGTSVHLGVRYKSQWHKVAAVSTEMSIQDVEGLRAEAVLLARRLQDEEVVPGLARGRAMTVEKLHEEFMRDFRETRGESRSEKTLECYEELWRVHLLPKVGSLKLTDITADVVHNLRREIPLDVLTRVPSAKAGGRPIANRALQQLDAALNFAYRREWISRNPASARLVPRYQETRATEFLDAAGYSSVGAVLRDLEAQLAAGRSAPISLTTLYALRITIYTGVRHRSELLWTQWEWCQLDSTVPRIGVPRAKGDRGGAGGRWIFLGPDSVRLLRAIPRRAGSEHLTVPGKRSGAPLFRLNEAWSLILKEAGLPPMTVKALRHSWSTHSVGIIAPEHRQQLMGHRGMAMTDTVYLHQHGPDLGRAATKVEEHLRVLLGDVVPESSRVLAFDRPRGVR
jgi:integrase